MENTLTPETMNRKQRRFSERIRRKALSLLISSTLVASGMTALIGDFTASASGDGGGCNGYSECSATWSVTDQPTCTAPGDWAWNTSPAHHGGCIFQDDDTRTGTKPDLSQLSCDFVSGTCTTAGTPCAKGCGQTAPALGHEWSVGGDGWYVETPAQIGVAGVERRTCVRTISPPCNFTETRPIAALDPPPVTTTPPVTTAPPETTAPPVTTAPEPEYDSEDNDYIDLMFSDANFKFDDKYEDLLKVYLNDTLLDYDLSEDGSQWDLYGYGDYSDSLGKAYAGTTNVTLYKEFLQTLFDGIYVVTVEFKDGSRGNIEFTIDDGRIPTASLRFFEDEGEPSEPEDDDDNPQTSAVLIFAPLSTAIIAFAAFALSRKKKED